MGNFVLSDVSLLEKMHNSDELQIYYYNNEIFDKEHQYHKINETSGSVSAKFFSPTMVGFDKSIDKEIEFLTRIKMTFISTDWANSIITDWKCLTNDPSKVTKSKLKRK